MYDKQERLRQLALKRQKSNWPGYSQIGDYHNGIYECEHVSPYTKSAGNVDAQVFVLLQDWSSHDRLSGPIDPHAVKLGHTPKLPTNRRLTRLLGQYFKLTLQETYGTNLFPFIKSGTLTGNIPTRDLTRAAVEFALPQIEIVEPTIVVCLGVSTFRSIQRAIGRRPSRNTDEAIANPFHLANAQIWCQAHTGNLGTNNRNRGQVDRVSRDWAAMSEVFNQTRFSD